MPIIESNINDKERHPRMLREDTIKQLKLLNIAAHASNVFNKKYTKPEWVTILLLMTRYAVLMHFPKTDLENSR